MKSFYETYQQILNDKNLSREEKVILLQQAKENYDRQVTQERNREIAKYRLGAALEIGSAAIPMSGVGRIGAQIGLNALKSNLGRKIAEEIGSGIASGAASGALFGAGRGMLENKNPITTSIQDSLIGGLSGGALGAGGAYLQKGIRANYLEKSKPELGIIPKEAADLRRAGKQYYNDYLHELKIKTGNGNIINFPNSQAGEIGLHNYKMIPHLPNQIKNANNIVKSNDKTRSDALDFEKMYNTHNNKNYEYLIRNNSNNAGKDFYQIKEVGPNPAYSHQNRALELEPNPIIHNNSSKINSPNGQLEQIFTREQIKNMTSEEFLKNEKAIMKQMKEKGIPTNSELEQKRKQTKSSTAKSTGKGRWVTINGNHVFIED